MNARKQDIIKMKCSTLEFSNKYGVLESRAEIRRGPSAAPTLFSFL